MKDNMCKIPMTATYSIINGKPVMTAAEYVDIPADAIARYLVDKLGVNAIFEGAGA